MFKMQFSTENAAFENCPESEIARILRYVADKIENMQTLDSGYCRDANGNRVGEWSWSWDAPEGA